MYSKQAYDKCMDLFTFQYGSTLMDESCQVWIREDKFTFQYGSTLIKSRNQFNCLSRLFTFQYGSTLMENVSWTLSALIYLHSNMVLL